MAPPKHPWFRFYVEAIHDRKLRRIQPAERWLWVVVLACARSSCQPGTLLIGEGDAATVEDMADLAAMKRREVEVGMQHLIETGMVALDERGSWYVPKFLERQYESDNANVRSTKHRRSNGDATAMQRRIDAHNAVDATPPDTEADTDTDTYGVERSLRAVSAPNQKPAPRSMRITAEMAAWAMNHGFNDLDLPQLTEGFLEHYRARGQTFADWEAAWQKWIRKADEFAKRDAIRAPTASNAQRASVGDRNTERIKRIVGAMTSEQDHPQIGA